MTVIEQESRTQTSSPEVTVRPVFLVNKPVFMSYAPYIRRILVGLTGASHGSALVCPRNVNSAGMLCPMVESIQHPMLQLPIFHFQNKHILMDRLIRFKPTLLHTFYPGQIRLANKLSRMLDIPYVVTFHKAPSHWMRYTQMVRQAAAVITSSEAIEKQLLRIWPGIRGRVNRVHLGTYVEDECSCFSRPDCIPGLIAVAPLDSLKTFAPFLNAVRHLALDGHELMVALMGTGPAENMIRTHIRKLGLKPMVTVIPPVRPLRNIFSGADMVVHLSERGEIDGLLLEAMAVGLAVVGAPETTSGLLKDGQTAAFWDPHDELDIYAKLKELLSTRERTRQLAMNAQAHLRENNNVSGMVERLTNSYVQAQQWHKHNRKIQEQTQPPQPAQ